MKRYLLGALGGGALMLGTALAQSTTAPAPGSTPAETQRLNGRLENQGDRIQQGVKSGQLTRRQGRALWRRDKQIHRRAAAANRARGGNLSQRQEQRISRAMNRQSRRIYRARH